MDTRIRAVSDNVQHAVTGWQELYGVVAASL